jgi:hypothetical protein
MRHLSDNHKLERTSQGGVKITSPNGLRIRVTPGMAKIETDGPISAPYRNPAQAIAHVATMFDAAAYELKKEWTPETSEDEAALAAIEATSS